MKSEINYCHCDNKNHNHIPSGDGGSEQFKEKQNKDIEANCNASTQYDDQSENEKRTIVQEKGYSYIFTIIYFFTSIIMVFFLIIFNLISEYFFTNRPDVKITKHVPEFYNLKTISPLFFSSSVLIISIAGLFNVWHFCSMLLQRFSVPELSNNKVIVHFMFIFGSFSHFIFIFFGFSPAVIGIQTMKLSFIDISLTMVIFIVFMIFNILFATLAWMAIEMLRFQNSQTAESLKNSVRMKIYVIFFAVLTLFLYIISIIAHNTYKETNFTEGLNNQYYLMLKLAVLILPYLLYIINAFLNLTYYSDILKIQAHLNVFLDRDFFILSNEENTLLFK